MDSEDDKNIEQIKLPNLDVKDLEQSIETWSINLDSQNGSESSANNITHELISIEVMAEAFKTVDRLAELEKTLDNLKKNVEEIETNRQETFDKNKESKLKSKVKYIIHDLLLNIYQYFVISNGLDQFIRHGAFKTVKLNESFINSLFAERSIIESQMSKNDLENDQKIIELLMTQPLHKQLLTFLSSKNISAKDFLFFFDKLDVFEARGYIFLNEIISGKTAEFVNELESNKEIAFSYITKFDDIISVALATRMFSVFD